jgi:aminomethyltransferase
MDEHTDPYEARLGWVVRTEKPGDFIGRNALRQLKSGPRRPDPGGPGDGRPRDPPPGIPGVPAGRGRPIGTVTSGTFSPVRGKGVALARVEAAAVRATADGRLDVPIRDGRHPARIVPLPFYKNV